MNRERRPKRSRTAQEEQPGSPSRDDPRSRSPEIHELVLAWLLDDDDPDLLPPWKRRRSPLAS